MSHRRQRVEDLVRQQVAQILLRDMQDPRIRLASVSSVRNPPAIPPSRTRAKIR